MKIQILKRVNKSLCDVVWQALVACKLYKSMAHEAAQDDLEIDISDELRGFAK